MCGFLCICARILLIPFSASLFYVLERLGCLTKAFGKMASVLLGFFFLANELFWAFNKTLKYRSKIKQVPSKEGEMEGVGGGVRFYICYELGM